MIDAANLRVWRLEIDVYPYSAEPDDDFWLTDMNEEQIRGAYRDRNEFIQKAESYPLINVEHNPQIEVTLVRILSAASEKESRRKMPKLDYIKDVLCWFFRAGYQGRYTENSLLNILAQNSFKAARDIFFEPTTEKEFIAAGTLCALLIIKDKEAFKQLCINVLQSGIVAKQKTEGGV